MVIFYGNLPQYFNPKNSRVKNYHVNLLWYCFITLAPGRQTNLENDLSIVPITDLTNSQFGKFRHLIPHSEIRETNIYEKIVIAT